MNKVFLMGRLTKDPEIKTSNDRKRTVYTLAVDGYDDHTDFVYCVAFGKNGEFASKYLKKGAKILIEGSLNVTTTGEGEMRRTYTNVVVNSHYFCESKKKASEGKEEGGNW